ncbi:Yip1 domain family protein [Exidia glandulosa HHB12029]|uniref:Protein YIP n=1 Tax=Exidia glandulosa HHB12029 TaxID=1314781 RepID=A0A166AXD5_EXIGL|nr:Yip1 domain family protein [Exidia glandulosa HHB12029]
MAYQTIEQDDVLDQPKQQLEFKSYLGAEATAENGTSAGASRTGYRAERPANTSFWQVEHYQRYFDVDTSTVLRRCYTTMIPTAAGDYIANQLSPAPDLYGPFWTLTTVIFSLFVFSGLSSSIAGYMSGQPIEYDFKLLSIAVTLVYTYGLGVPVLLWLALRYLGVTEWSVIEAIAIFGYGQSVWIPVSFICIAWVRLVRYISVGIAFGLSGYFLVANVYPILATAEAKAARLLVIIVAVLHAALAISFQVLFFSYYPVDPIGPGIPGIDQPIGGGTGTNTTSRLI